MLRTMLSFGSMLLLAGAMIFMTTSAVQARGGGGGGHGGGGGGHGGGFHGGSFHSGGQLGGYHGGYYHGGYRGGYYHGGHDRGYGYRHYYGGYYPYSGSYPYYSFYNYYPYLYGGDDTLENAYANDTPYLSGSATYDSATYDSGYRGLSAQEYQAYAQAAPDRGARPPAPIDSTAHVTVRVPADAQVWIEGTKTTSTGAMRQFQSPPLTPGSRYTYDIKASWNESGREMTQTQHVQVTAGARTNVTFPTTAQTAAK